MQSRTPVMLRSNVRLRLTNHSYSSPRLLGDRRHCQAPRSVRAVSVPPEKGDGRIGR